MRQLADGEVDVKVMHQDQADEIGLMAKALEVFQNSGRRKSATDAAQAEQRQEAEEQKRAVPGSHGGDDRSDCRRLDPANQPQSEALAATANEMRGPS